MLDILIGEPDLLFRVFRHLSIQSVTQLRLLHSPIKKFIAANKRIINSSQDATFHIVFPDSSSLHLSTKTEIGQSFCISIVQDEELKREKLGLGEFLGSLTPAIHLFRNNKEQGIKVCIPKSLHSLSQNLHVILTHFMEGFQFQSMQFRPCFEQQNFDAFKAICKWLVKERVTIDSLTIKEGSPSEALLIAIVQSLGIAKLELYLQNDRNQANQASKQIRFSYDFVRHLPTLRRFATSVQGIQLRDEDLERLDRCEMNVLGQRQYYITQDGVLAWAMRKFASGQIGDCLNFLWRNVDAVHLADSFPSTYLKKENRQTYRQKVLVRCPKSGQWLRFEEGYIGVEDSYQINREVVYFCLIPGKNQQCDDDNPVKFLFHIANNFPNGCQPFLIERWAANISLYETDFQRYLILVDTAVLEKHHIIQAIRILGSKLRHLQFEDICCFEPALSTTLELAEELHHQLPQDFHVPTLRLKGIAALTEALFCRVINTYQIRTVKQETSFNERRLLSPWLLSADFFNTTTSLTAFSLAQDAATNFDLSKHKLELSDEVLLRFATFYAPNTLTRLTVSGIRAWLTKRSEQDNAFSSLFLQLPLENDVMTMDEYFAELTDGMRGHRDQTKDLVFVFGDDSAKVYDDDDDDDDDEDDGSLCRCHWLGKEKRKRRTNLHLSIHEGELEVTGYSTKKDERDDSDKKSIESGEISSIYSDREMFECDEDRW